MLSTSPDPRHRLILWNPDVLNCYITLKCIICNNYLTTELAHSKLKYGFIAELLVIMTDRLKIVKIRARNVTLPRVHGHKRLDDDVSFSGVSFSLQESDGVVFSMLWGTVLLKHKKTRPGTTCACLAVASKQESCRNSMASSLWHQIWAIWL